jgi:hypothetical protein
MGGSHGNCLKDQSGQLPGKTIPSHDQEACPPHRRLFEEMYPQHVGVAQVITSTTERVRDGSYGDGLITKFKKNNLARIAISVDMLDTGIDVPEVVNLVFMKPVQSRIKLWQMIGRGTRNQQACKYLGRLPDGKKTEFKIIDFWQNDFNKKADDKPPIDIRCSCRFSTRDSRSSNVTFLTIPPRPFASDHGPSRHDGPRPARFLPREEGVAASGPSVETTSGRSSPGKTGLPPSPLRRFSDSPPMSMWLPKPSPIRWSGSSCKFSRLRRRHSCSSRLRKT